jgi:hypothetical protein
MTKQNIFQCKCDSNYTAIFPSFTFYGEDGKAVKINPEEYIYNNNNPESVGNNCLLMIGLNYKNDYWIFGSNFLNNYYSIFDLEKEKILFQDNRGRNGGDLDSTLLFCAIVFVCSLIFFLIIHYIYKRIMERREENNRM